MRHLDQPRAPDPTNAIGFFEEILQILPNEQVIPPGHRLIGEKSLQPIQQLLGVNPQKIDQVAVTAVAEQHLEQMLHIKLAMAPTARQVLA